MANNIKRHIDKLGMTVKDFAITLDFKYTTVLDWVNAKTYPRIDKIEIMANYFGVEKSDLVELYTPQAHSELVTAITDKVVQLDPPRQESVLDYASDQLEAQQQEKASKVTSIEEKRAEYDSRKRIVKNVDGTVSAGSGAWQEYDHDNDVSFYQDDILDDDDYDTIAVVVGHSMQPKIKHGDFLFIKLTPQVDMNTIGIFQVNGENYVKKLRQDQNGTPYLESLNKEYNDIPLTPDDNIRTIGEVVDIYREG
ncbi:helix-turn-helix transcriptional regulator [Streptococcus cuniculipharyngis]|uniref:Helix-turn-helix transcriptional regulator n=2 Tax=Streptococcus cuniculipharyngis TaxID=1562651 RepID=A0A5C5SGN3_9STRE|nr:helix-turn-helix transcriptional regulator [Streptococcus cuniculipharyngis]